MLKNYFKTAWRNIIKSKGFSFISIAGLALGLSCSLLIMLWVQDERSVDAFNKNGKYLYQVYERNYFDGKVDASYSTQGLLAEELKRVIPEIQFSSGLENSYVNRKLPEYQSRLIQPGEEFENGRVTRTRDE